MGVQKPDEPLRQAIEGAAQAARDASEAAKSARDAAASAERAAASAQDVAHEAQETAASGASTAERLRGAVQTAIGLLFLLVVILVGLTAWSLLTSENGSQQPRISTPDAIAIVAAGVAIALIVVGVVSPVEPQPTGNYLDRELAERRAGRTALTATAVVFLGVVLLASTMVVVNTRTSGSEAPAASSAPAGSPSPEASS